MHSLHTNLDAPTRNLQNITDNHADQPSKRCVTLYRIHMLPLLNHRVWKQLIFKNVYVQEILCNVIEHIM
jgi:hypothetical protein